uniref:U3 snoRNP-associated protein-like EMB2271 n=1 Tax=Cannabis sativa TaxID=3483 RepID=A0A803QE73_CANSA
MNNKRGSGPKGSKKGKASSISDEAFFGNDPKKRRKKTKNDDFIESSDSDDDFFGGSDGDDGANGDLVEETVDETRKRLATELLEKMRKSAKEEGDDDDEGGDSDKEIEEGERDSLVAQLLQQKQLEESGRLRRLVASRVQKPEASDQFQLLVKHRQPVTAVVLSEDDSKGFSAAKDGTILHWDVESGRGEKYRWPSDAVLKSHGAKDPQGRASKHSKLVFSLAVSSDGRYLASGGSDRHVHLWDTRTREHIQAFPGHRGPVSCLTFRQGTSELFSGSYDRTVKIWNAEDRAYISSLFGHQSEVLTIDCLRKERVLTVGRDRSMQLFKVPEESRLVFRAPASSLECCCFISNDEFLSGTDDGSVELWSLLRKKPAYIVKNAHSLLAANKNIEQKDCPMIPNGHIENGHHTSEKYDSSSVYSWVSSVAVCRSSDLAASGAVMVLFACGVLGVKPKTLNPYTIYLWNLDWEGGDASRQLKME